MSITINIPVNVPQGFNLKRLTEQLSEYAKTLIADSQPTGVSDKHYKHEALCGIFDDDTTKEKLVESYLKEKYDL